MRIKLLCAFMIRKDLFSDLRWIDSLLDSNVFVRTAFDARNAMFICLTRKMRHDLEDLFSDLHLVDFSLDSHVLLL